MESYRIDFTVTPRGIKQINNHITLDAKTEAEASRKFWAMAGDYMPHYISQVTIKEITKEGY